MPWREAAHGQSERALYRLQTLLAGCIFNETSVTGNSARDLDIASHVVLLYSPQGGKTNILIEEKNGLCQSKKFHHLKKILL